MSLQAIVKGVGPRKSFRKCLVCVEG